MGAWGIRALDSDEGLDVLDFLKGYCTPDRTALRLEDIIAAMKGDGFFGDTFEEIDFYYDSSALALTELYLGWLDTGTFLPQDGGHITEFTASGESIGFLLRYLRDIRNEVPDGDGERELAALWRDSPHWGGGGGHFDAPLPRLEGEINKC